MLRSFKSDQCVSKKPFVSCFYAHSQYSLIVCILEKCNSYKLRNLLHLLPSVGALLDRNFCKTEYFSIKLQVIWKLKLYRQLSQHDLHLSQIRLSIIDCNPVTALNFPMKVHYKNKNSHSLVPNKSNFSGHGGDHCMPLQGVQLTQRLFSSRF